MRRAWPYLLLAAAASPAALAQEAPGPPKVLIINREEIKPGKMGAHDKSAARFISVLNKAKAGSYRIGLVPVSGDDNQVVYLEGYNSFAELETARKDFDGAVAMNAALRAELEQVTAEGDLHASQKTAIAVLREDLSYKPERMDAVAKARYMTVNRTTVKPGRVSEFVELAKQLNAARDKAGANWVNTAVYQVVTGAPAGTFITLALAKSLAEWDEFSAKMDERTKAVDAALGGAEVVKQRRIQISEVVADTMMSLYAFNPSLSRPTEQFVAYDPGFWKPQPAASEKALAVKKERPKN